jgi:hypothetical protein
MQNYPQMQMPGMMPPYYNPYGGYQPYANQFPNQNPINPQYYQENPQAQSTNGIHNELGKEKENEKEGNIFILIIIILNKFRKNWRK